MSETLETATQGGVEPAVDADVTLQPSETAQGESATTETKEANPDDTQAEEQPKRKPWFEKVIADRSYEAREAKRQAEYWRSIALQQQPAQAQAPQQDAQQPPPGYVPVTEVARVAAQQLERAQFDQACNEIADHGESQFRDFNQAVQNFQMLGGPPPALLEAVTALGKEDGAKVFYELGMNPDEAMRLSRLSPARMAVEVAKMASKPAAAAKPVSRVPSPITPISAARAEPGGEPDASRNPEAWNRWFLEQRAARRR